MKKLGNSRNISWEYLLVEDRLWLTTKTLLLSVVSSGTLSNLAVLALLVLGDFVDGVLLALVTGAVCLLSLRESDHNRYSSKTTNGALLLRFFFHRDVILMSSQ